MWSDPSLDMGWAASVYGIASTRRPMISLVQNITLVVCETES